MPWTRTRPEVRVSQPESNVKSGAAGSLLWILILALVVVAVWAAWAMFGARAVYQAVLPSAAAASAPTVADLGQLGDLFGGVNALFAALAVAGVFWAALLQRRALIETRQALTEERAATARQ